MISKISTTVTKLMPKNIPIKPIIVIQVKLLKLFNTIRKISFFILTTNFGKKRN